jgi:predicted O-methyltransferase YrrM
MTAYGQAARPKVEPGALFAADNVLSHADPLAQYSAARKADPTLESVTLPLDRGMEFGVVLR